MVLSMQACLDDPEDVVLRILQEWMEGKWVAPDVGVAHPDTQRHRTLNSGRRDSGQEFVIVLSPSHCVQSLALSPDSLLHMCNYCTYMHRGEPGNEAVIFSYNYNRTKSMQQQ